MTNIPFDLPGFTVMGSTERDGEIELSIRPDEPTACPACGTIGCFVHNGRRQMKVQDLTIHEKPVKLWILRQRYRCKACGVTFRPPLSGISDRYQMTERLLDYLRRASFKGTNQELANRFGLHEKTIRSIFNERLEELNEAYDPVSPRVMGIDEIYLGRKTRCVITNVEERTLIEMLPTRNKDDVVKYLKGLKDGANIEIASMDMWDPYRLAFHEALPDVMLVADKFHVTRYATTAVDNVRKKVKATLNAKARSVLKWDRKFLLKRERDLSPQQQLVVSGWLNNYPDLRTAYQLKEQYFDVWDTAADAQEAEERFDAWRRSIPDEQKAVWKDLLRSEKNWRTEILNYFRCGKTVTNALTESINRRIRTVSRDGRGYSFESLRGKLLFAEEHKKRVTLKQSPFDCSGNVMYSTLSKMMHTEWDRSGIMIEDLGVDLSTS